MYPIFTQGTLVIATTQNILNDRDHWGDPETFRPERFLDSTGTQIVNTERNTIFGMCIHRLNPNLQI
jgi:cytochrome P450